METSVTGWICAGIGLVATVVVGYFSPYFIPRLQQTVRPVVKGIVKRGLVAGATISDLGNEVQAELTQSSLT